MKNNATELKKFGEILSMLSQCSFSKDVEVTIDNPAEEALPEKYLITLYKPAGKNKISTYIHIECFSEEQAKTHPTWKEAGINVYSDHFNYSFFTVEELREFLSTLFL